MTYPGKCPACGAPHLTRTKDLIDIFQCGTEANEYCTGTLLRSAACHARELAAERDALRAALTETRDAAAHLLLIIAECACTGALVLQLDPRFNGFGARADAALAAQRAEAAETRGEME